MNDIVRAKLKKLQHNFDSNYSGLKTYREKNGQTAAHRFWRLFREDLMRLSPEQLIDYLLNPNSKLSECALDNKDGFAQDLAALLQGDLENVRHWQDALIHFCLEMDVAWSFTKMTSPYVNKNDLRAKLAVMEVLDEKK